MIDCIMMDQRRAPAALGAETFCEHFHYAVEFFASEISIRPGRTDKLEELIFIPIFSGRCSDNLLGQDIQRFFGNAEAIEFPVTDTTKQCCAFDQFIAAQWEDAALRQTSAFMLGAPDALQQAGDGACR